MISDVQGVFKLIDNEKFNMNPLCWRGKGLVLGSEIFFMFYILYIFLYFSIFPTASIHDI